MSAWISVKERLPEDERSVLCFNQYRITIGWLLKSERWYEEYSDARLDGVTHWQPLPEPPEEP